MSLSRALRRPQGPCSGLRTELQGGFDGRIGAYQALRDGCYGKSCARRTKRVKRRRACRTSQSGLFGWLTGARSPNTKGIIAYEPGFVFPQGEMPAPIPLYKGTQVAGTSVTAAEFANLAKIPIQVVYGDNIPKSPIPDLVADGRRAQQVTSRLFVQALNSKGGNASVLLLPDAGLYGNSHFMFSDLNNVEVADQMSQFLRAKGLDVR